ncbi:MAG: hypothetical protein AMXMBFR7_17190 [Planctomycetota bacterium]
MAKRVIWIIDGGYMHACAPGRFDYLKLKHLLEGPGDGRFIESYFLDSKSPEPNEKQDAFLRWLKLASPTGPQFRVLPYALKTQRLTCPACGKEHERPVQKGVDVGIATLLIKLAAQDKYDRVLLSSGDGDLMDAVSYVKDDLKKEVYVAGFERSVSSDLQSVANRCVWLNPHWDEFKKDT